VRPGRIWCHSPKSYNICRQAETILSQSEQMSFLNNRPKMYIAQLIFVQINTYITCTLESSHKNLSTRLGIFHKTAKSKQSPNGRKFADSGHPALNQAFQMLIPCSRPMHELEKQKSRLLVWISARVLIFYVLCLFWCICEFLNVIHSIH
jgi:hypothetical protein